MILVLLTELPVFGQVSITPVKPPAVNGGATYQFTANVPVTWSMAAGSKGSINPTTGVYTAPTLVSAQQTYGGCQLLPNNHVFNTRIDSLPVHAQSSAWISGSGGVPVNYLPSFPVNYVDNSTPLQNMVFAYTSGNNGSFTIPAYPGARIETGWFNGPFTGSDRHLFTINTNSCGFQELYNLYQVGQNTFNPCPECTSQSGVKYSGSSYDLPANGATDAAGLYVMPLTLRFQELQRAVLTGGTINHALRFTLQNGYISGNSHLWPAMTHNPEGGTIPYGARFRLKSNFNISGFSPIAQILLTQLKQYGIILADAGYGWQVTTEYAKWPKTYRDAFDEIRYAEIAPANFEAVDESSLMVSNVSGTTPIGEAVIATSVSDATQSARQQIVLTGVGIGLTSDQKYIQATSPAQQFTAFVNGTTNTAVTWSMNPQVGTLTAAGLYTPPSNVTLPTVTTVTATSAANSAVSAAMSLTVLPAGPIRLMMGRSDPYPTTSYTDRNGNIWYASTGDDGGHPYDNGGTWPTSPDVSLYKIAYFAGNDMRFDITVPNGTYQITGKFAETESWTLPGDRLMNLEAQGQVIHSNVDLVAAAGGPNRPIDFALPATVTNNHLAFVARHVKGSYAIISALEILLTAAGAPGPTIPAAPTNLTIINVR